MKMLEQSKTFIFESDTKFIQILHSYNLFDTVLACTPI